MPIRFALRAMACLIFIGIAAMNIALASIGGAAQRGDNCTPTNRYAIGFPIPDGEDRPNTIVQQTVILEHGWQLAGWILTGRSGRLVLVPYGRTTPYVNGDLGLLFTLPSTDPKTIRATWAAARARAVKLTPDIAPYFAESIGALVLSPCYKQALPVGQ
jgi:hypothetical protein